MVKEKIEIYEDGIRLIYYPGRPLPFVEVLCPKCKFKFIRNKLPSCSQEKICKECKESNANIVMMQRV